MDRKCEGIAVVELHKARMKTADILRSTDFKPVSVCRAVKEIGGSEDRLRKGRPFTSYTREIVQKIHCQAQRNP
ncbi:hypothetical protein KIN20_020936 [Parelaphostrongylus tenuis]|uniref:Uncharacterized protein n=1 Tax=Parelaphostrongylus tenuis TaxID=148309 RepID=A0AAD5N4P6_PARTN|nr:hypothetical protein KIN20_020936 [Parelaphostrongylus tenuis]